MAGRNFDQDPMFQDPRVHKLPTDETQGGRAIPRGQLPRTRRALSNLFHVGHTNQIAMRYDPKDGPVYRDTNIEN